jgi:hypothetical protein
MIQCQGTGLIWDGVGLWGRRFQDTPPKNPEQNKEIGIRICNSCDPSSSGSELDRAGKIWFKSLCVEDCRIGVQATGSQPADSCAFGYYRPNYCVTAVHLDSTLSTMFTFRYMHPFGCNTAFRVDNGGRIYVHAINVVMTGAGTRYLLDVQGGTEVDAFFHINGMKVDGNVDTFVVLNNVDDGDGLHLFRFTDAQFYRDQGRQATVNIDREGGSGQSVLEFVGARWMEEPLDGRITINGASANKPSRLIVRDSMLDDIGDLIAGGSSHYSTDAVRNWTLANGVGFS